MKRWLSLLLAALILSGVLARRVSRRIVEPLNTLDLDHPLKNDVYEELTPLLKRINAQHQEIEAQMRELRRRTDAESSEDIRRRVNRAREVQLHTIDEALDGKVRLRRAVELGL